MKSSARSEFPVVYQRWEESFFEDEDDVEDEDEKSTIGFARVLHCFSDGGSEAALHGVRYPRSAAVLVASACGSSTLVLSVR